LALTAIILCAFQFNVEAST